jgi:GalNAc-alpha-(1->4)-GalNAc-alpha-(1->3)-diNAcBac-PP-undecaprenol alpha-1,4-N-acetyl-D-galactosaminyltransferase
MGGMERQLLSIATGFLDRGHIVTVITLDSAPAEPFFESDPRIVYESISIGDSQIKATFQERIQRQKRIFEILDENEIDVVVAFMTGSFWFAAIPAKLRRIPIILAERNGPSIYTRTRVRKIRHLIFVSMLLANAITVQFEAYKGSYPFYLRKRIVPIPNRISVFGEKKKNSSRAFTYLFAGRLSNQKQINELVSAFIVFHRKYKDTQLEIYGKGEQASILEGLIKNNSAEGFITLHAPIKDISVAMSEADVLIAPSLWEGFPNSVAEALAHGVPAAGFTDCEGIRDLISNGRNGWLIKRDKPVESLVELLKIVYDSRAQLPIFSKLARNSVKPYQNEAPNDQWNRLIFALKQKRIGIH